MNNLIVTTSWDDGHILDKRLAELLIKYGIKGTFYVSPKHRQFSRKELLSDKDIVNLSKNFEIGGHTISHPTLTKISHKSAEMEIINSKIYLENLLDKEVVSFCYPKGKYNSKIRKLVKKAGFKYARTTQRHKFALANNNLESATSIHTFRQYKDMFNIANISQWNAREFLKNMDWEHLAKKVFDGLEKGDIYHLWGHSWIIDRKDEWNKLERVLSYIGGRLDISYLENKELVK